MSNLKRFYCILPPRWAYYLTQPRTNIDIQLRQVEGQMTSIKFLRNGTETKTKLHFEFIYLLQCMQIHLSLSLSVSVCLSVSLSFEGQNSGCVHVTLHHQYHCLRNCYILCWFYNLKWHFTYLKIFLLVGPIIILSILIVGP